MRRIFVGDIQGCLDQLEELLGKVDFRPGIDVLHPVGDLVNKGPDSEGVLALLMELDAKPVLGNHDRSWLRRGLIDDPEQHEWLASQPVVRIFDDVIVVHAGLHPLWQEEDLLDMEDGQIDFATTVRYCDERGNRPEGDWPPPKKPFRPWDHFYSGDKRVVFGHWARRGLDQTDKVVALDSGCVYGKKLSAWVAEEDRIVQVPGWKSPSSSST